MVCPQAGLAGDLVFPVLETQKDLYNVVQPERASGKLLNVESPVSDLFPLTFPLVFKIKQIQKCKTKPFWDNEWKETELRQQELAKGP